MEKRIVKPDEANIKLFEFGFEVTKEVHSLGQFVNLVKNGSFKWNDPLQRGYVWSMKKRSALIVSGIEGVNIGELKAEIIRESGKRKRNIIDGKQRGLTLYHFRQDKWALAEKTFVKGVDSEGNEVLIDISGLKFSELPEIMQERINSVQINIECYENLTSKLKAELFYRWNNGEPLKAVEKRKSIMSDSLREAISEIKNSKTFQVGFTEAAIERDANGEAVQQALTVLMTNGDTGLGSSVLDSMAEGGQYTEEVIQELKTIVGYLDQVVDVYEEKEQKEVFKKNKVTAMVLAAQLALDKNITPQLFSDWAYEFFVRGYKERGFSQYSSTTKKDNVKKRIEIMLNDFRQFFNLQD